MLLKINEFCVNCDVCELVCFNQVILMGEIIYVIDLVCCIECVGYFDEFQCVVVCLVECIDFDLDILEIQEVLLVKLYGLQCDYFELYVMEFLFE